MTMDIATLGINVDARQVREGDRALDSFERTGRRTEQTTDRLNGTMARLQRMAAAVAAALSVAELVKYADTWANLEGRLRLVTDSTYQLVQAQNALYSIAQRTRTSLEGTVDLYGRIKRSTADLNASDAQRLRVTESINKSLIISGASSQAAAAALLQLGQAFGANRLGGEELNSILEQTPRLAQAIAEGMGRTVGELKKLGADGKLTAEVVFNALQQSGASLDAEFSKMPRTVGQAFVQIQNAALRTIGVFDQQNQLSASLANTLGFVADNVGVLAAALAGLAVSASLRFVLNLTSGLWESLKASSAAALVARERAAATLAAAAADVEATAAASALAAARVAELRAATMAAEGEVQLALATNGLIPAQFRAAAAAEAHAAALAAQVTAQAAAAGAGTLMARALAFLGGPIGAITALLGIGVTAWLMWGDSAKKGEEQAEQSLAEKHVEIMAMLDKQIKKLDERNRLMQADPKAGKSNSPAADDMAATLAEIDRVSKDANLTDAARTEILRVLGARYNEATIALDKYNAAQGRLDAANKGDKVEQWLAKHTTYLSQAEQLAQEIKDAKKELGDAFTPDIEKRITKHFNDKAGKEQANKFKEAQKQAAEYIKTLQEETAQLGATESQQFMISAARKAAEAPTMKLRTRIMELALAYVTEKEKTDAAAQSKKDYEEAVKRHTDAMAQEVAGVAAAVDQAKREADTYGMGAEAVTRYTIAKLREKEARLQGVEGADDEITQVQMLIALNDKLLAQQSRKSNLEAMFDTAPVQSFGEALREAFGEAGNSLATLTNALQDYLDKQDAADKLRAKAKLKYAGDDKRVAREVAKINAQETKDRIGSYASMAGAAKGFFAENSKGYKALEAAERTFRAFELALTLQSMAKKLFATNTVTAATVAGNATQASSAVAGAATEVGAKTAVAQANAVAGVANQANGDPYSAFGRMAAMAAIMAALGIAVSGGGGSRPSVSQQRQAAQGTGSVLGDDSAKSESLRKALDLLADNSNVALAYTSQMAASLRSIDNGIAAMAAQVAGNAGLTGKTAAATPGGAERFASSTMGQLLIGGPITALLDKITGGWVGKTMGKIAGSIFGGKQSVEDTGFALGKASLGSLLGGGMLSANQYTDVKTSGGWFSSDKHDTKLASLGADTNDQFTKVVLSMADAVKAAGGALGMSGAAFEGKLASFVVDIGKISLKDMKPDEIEKAINAVFSKLGDDMAKWSVEGLQPFQKAGEGYLETLVRVAAGVEDAQYQLDRFGMKAIAYADVVEKQGNVGAEIVRQTILANECLAGTAEIMRTLGGSAQDLADTYAELRKAQESLAMAGIDPATLGRALVRGARDLGSLQDALDAYFDKFFTDQEKLAAKTENLRGKFAALGVEMPASIQGFNELVKGIPKTTEAGQTLLGQILLLAESFADLQDLAKDVADALPNDRLQQFKDAAQAAYDTLERSINAEKKARTAAHKAAMDALETQIKASQDNVSRLSNLSKAVHGTLDKLATAASALSDRRAALAQLANALATFRATGKAPDADSLQKSLGTVGQDASGLYSSRQEYLRDYYKTAIMLTDLADVTDDSLTVEQKTLQALQDRKDQAETQFQAEMDALDAQLDKAKEQLDALNGINNSILSLADALRAWQSTMRQGNGADQIAGLYQSILGRAPDASGLAFWQQQAMNGTSMGAISSAIANSPEAKVRDLYKSVLGRTGEQSGVDFWTKQLSAGVSLDTIKSSFYGSDEYKNNEAKRDNIPGFAGGGRHGGGWRVVGEDGPELAYTGPETIVSNSGSKDLLDQSGVEGAIEAMVDELRPWLYQIAKNTLSTDKTLTRFEKDGMPATRED